MQPWALAHLIALGMWGGLVLGEFVVELAPKDEAGESQAAHLHYWMDMLFELPLLAIVLATGAVLAWRAQPLTVLHWVKIVAGGLAVGINLACVVFVVIRRRHVADPILRRRATRWVKASAMGVPPALVALWIGLTRFA